jgi:hypothetical protein
MRKLQKGFICIGLLVFVQYANAQINLLNDYVNNTSATIGIFQNISFREAGFSSLYPIAGTNGKEFWTISDRGVNVDAAAANFPDCRPTYDKIYGFPSYAPKIHRIRINGDSIEILKTILLKRPNGETASGLLNPTGFGSTLLEKVSTDTVKDCQGFDAKTAAKDVWGIDSEGIVMDKQGNFWVCEEGGPTIWKINADGIVQKRFTPYAGQAGAQPQDVLIDTVFKYRKNNRGFEGIAIAPNGKIYAIIQSPLLYPDAAAGENSQIHRILEINPLNNTTRMFVYLNEGVIGTGSNQIRLKDWKIGDMAAINNHEFLVIEAGTRGATDVKKVFKIDISAATPVTAGLYGNKTVEALKDSVGLDSVKIVPVQKKLFLDLLVNGWTPTLDKSEGIAIVNDSTIAVGNDNDYGQICPSADGIAIATTIKSHVMVFGLKGENKLTNYVLPPAFTPEINLTGNNETIQDGDSIASILDNTHFGNVSTGGTSSKEFVIQNTGFVTLSVNAISFAGEHASEFSLSGSPTFPRDIAVGGNLPIQVLFQPLEGGTRNAFLYITNNDTDENSYDIKLEGEATFTTGIHTDLKPLIKVYPNPSNQLTIVEIADDKQNDFLRVFNVQGKQVALAKKSDGSTGLQRFHINTSELSDGVYYLEIMTKMGMDNVKLVVMH